MSWKGFQKAVARLPQQIGGGNATVDDHYNELAANITALDAATQRLFADSRTLKQSLLGALEHQEKMAHVLMETYAPISSTPRSGETSPQPRKEASPQSIKAAQEYADAMRSAREQLVPDLDLIDRRVTQPAKELLDILQNIKKVMTKRDHKLLDYDRHRGNLDKIKNKPEKTVADERSLAKAEQEFQEATRVYTNINNLLIQELPIFLSYRSQFIDPCFQTLYVVQRRVFQTMYSVFERLAQISKIDLTTSAQEGWEMRKDEGEDLLNQLGIIKGSWRTAAQAAIAAAQVATSPTSENAPSLGVSTLGVPGNDAPPDYVQSIPGPPPAHAPGGPAYSRTSSPGKEFKKAPPPPPPQKKATYVVALYDFDAQQDGDLSFKKDDKIEVLEKTQDVNDWWKGKVNGRTGNFPANYTSPL